MTSRVVLGSACAACALSSIASAAIIRYDASIGTVPTEQGFAYTGSIASPIDTNGPTLQHGPTTALDVSAWQKQFPTGTINFANSTWTASMTVRLTGSDFGTYQGTRRAGYHIFVSDDAGRWIIAELGSNSIGLRNDAIGTGDPAVSVPMSATFRTVMLEAGPSGAKLYLDGALQATLPLGTGQTVRNHFLWGDGSNTTHVDLAEVRDVTLVPAPGVAGVGFAAAALAIGRRRRR